MNIIEVLFAYVLAIGKISRMELLMALMQFDTFCQQEVLDIINWHSSSVSWLLNIYQVLSPFVTSHKPCINPMRLVLPDSDGFAYFTKLLYAQRCIVKMDFYLFLNYKVMQKYMCIVRFLFIFLKRQNKIIWTSRIHSSSISLNTLKFCALPRGNHSYLLGECLPISFFM